MHNIFVSLPLANRDSGSLSPLWLVFCILHEAEGQFGQHLAAGRASLSKLHLAYLQVLVLLPSDPLFFAS